MIGSSFQTQQARRVFGTPGGPIIQRATVGAGARTGGRGAQAGRPGERRGRGGDAQREGGRPAGSGEEVMIWLEPYSLFGEGSGRMSGRTGVAPCRSGAVVFRAPARRWAGSVAGELVDALERDPEVETVAA